MKNLIFLSLVVALFASCNPYTPFTTNLKANQGWDEDDLKKIQYYLSDDIVLWRKFSEGESKIEGGTIKLKNGEKIEEIVFKRGTPGVLISTPASNRFRIAFESSDDKVLTFGPGKRGNEFVLLATNWTKQVGTISYGGNLYNTDSNSAISQLMVDLRAIKDVDVDRQTVEGRKVK